MDEKDLFVKSTWEWDPFAELRTIPQGWDLSEIYRPHEGELDSSWLLNKEE
jgi:hypothetical protein